MNESLNARKLGMYAKRFNQITKCAKKRDRLRNIAAFFVGYSLFLWYDRVKKLGNLDFCVKEEFYEICK